MLPATVGRTRRAHRRISLYFERPECSGACESIRTPWAAVDLTGPGRMDQRGTPRVATEQAAETQGECKKCRKWAGWRAVVRSRERSRKSSRGAFNWEHGKGLKSGGMAARFGRETPERRLKDCLKFLLTGQVAGNSLFGTVFGSFSRGPCHPLRWERVGGSRATVGGRVRRSGILTHLAA